MESLRLATGKRQTASGQKTNRLVSVAALPLPYSQLDLKIQYLV
jgi:hypothetical protein